jgi:ribosomal protein S18 acetylase RimI-like enzyme
VTTAWDATDEVAATWPTVADDELRDGVHGLFTEVVRSGGAVGWETPPTRAAIDTWLDSTLMAIRSGDGGLLVLGDRAAPLAMGTWRRADRAVHRHVAELSKVMSRPSARGRGLGRTVTTALLGALPPAGVEIATLATRGNNEVAMALYGSLGFREYGRIPGGILAQGARYDDVRFVLALP